MDINNLWKGWRVEEFIGEGSFGKVYKIVKEEFGYTYKAALKVLQIPQSQSEVQIVKREGLSGEETAEYFRNMVEDIVDEIVLMSKLKGNSNIVGYEDHIVVEKEDGYGWDVYIKMELLTPLFEYIECNGFTEKDVINLGIDICKALEVCQKSNIIHRDIKPENIFVSEMGNFKLGDFGIARQLEKTTAGLSKKGTYTYMAPEVYKGLEYNSTVDIYSLGIVLYRLLNNNRTPFMPAAPEKIKYTDKENANIKLINGEKIPSPCNATGRLAEVILKACEYKPKDRYQNPTEMKKDLEEILTSSSDNEILHIQSKQDSTVYLFNENAKKENPEKEKIEYVKTEPEITPVDKLNEVKAEESKDLQKEENKEEIKGNQENKKRGLLVGSIGAIVLCIAIVAVIYANIRSYVVPNCIGMAIEDLDVEHLDVIVVDEVFSETFEKGKIISQNVKAGEKLKKGSRIEVVLSKGMETEVEEDVVEIFIGGSKKSRSYMAILKGDTSEEYTFTVSDYAIESYFYESTNTDCFTITELEDGNIIVNALEEGTGYVVLNVETTDGKSLTEKILVSVYQTVEHQVCEINKKCNIYKGASEDSEVDNYNTKGILKNGFKAEIRSSCGDYYIIKTLDGKTFSDKKDTGFVKKSDVDIVE